MCCFLKHQIIRNQVMTRGNPNRRRHRGLADTIHTPEAFQDLTSLGLRFSTPTEEFPFFENIFEFDVSLNVLWLAVTRQNTRLRDCTTIFSFHQFLSCFLHGTKFVSFHQKLSSRDNPSAIVKCCFGPQIAKVNNLVASAERRTKIVNRVTWRRGNTSEHVT